MKLLPTLLLLAGCSSLDASQMVPADHVVTRHHSHSVRIEAAGSPRKLGVGARVVTGGELLAALREAILTSGLFERVVQGGSADYVLSVSVLSVEKSDPGLEMTAKAEMRWSLRRTADKSFIWEKTLSSASETNSTDASFMDERGQMALEAAVRKNLSRGLAHIGELEL